MKQSTLTLLLPIQADSIDDLRERLRARGDAIQAGDTARYDRIPGLHFLSCCILEKKQPNGLKAAPPTLVVELCVDGELQDFLRWVVENRIDELDEILCNCEGYPGKDAPVEALVEYLSADRSAGALYFGTPGRTVGQIREQATLRARLGAELDGTAHLAMSRRLRWTRAAKAVRRSCPNLAEVPKRPWRVRLSPDDPRLRPWLRELAVLATQAVLAVAGLLAAAWWLRAHWIVLAAVPMLVGVLAAGLSWRESPRGLKRGARGPILRLAARELVVTALGVAAALGLVVAAIELGLGWSALATAIGYGVSALLAFATVAIVATIAFTLSGPRLAWLAALVCAGLLISRFVAAAGPGWLIVETFLAALVPLALFLLAAVFYARALRRREASAEIWDEPEDTAHLALVTRREYAWRQSHLASEADVQEGWLRMFTLLSVLRWVGLLAWYWFNRGRLDRISSIHFARFVVLRERRSLLFLSNYDGRFEDYLGEFAETRGVTAVWGNAVGFSRPFLLVFDGARRENLFKRYARRSQMESLLWYSAYPQFSVAEIDRASELRECMAREIDDGATGYFARARRWWRQPLDEPTLYALMDGR